MIVKTFYKSHFKIKTNLKKNLDKSIFTKNIVIFVLFSQIFFKNCKISIKFSKKENDKTNLLKAPSRHKKFFHQIFYEYFSLVFFFFFKNVFISLTNVYAVFIKLGLVFLKIGSNTISRTKYLVSTPTQKYFCVV